MLSSCAVEEARHTLNRQNVGNIDYTPDKIVGLWVTVSPNKTGNPSEDDTKIYYDIKPGNRGRTRQFSMYKATGHHISMEAQFSWKYLGQNRWQISLPGIEGYKITENKGVNVGTIAPRMLIASYHSDELMVSGSINGINVGMVWVRANEQNIKESLRRARLENPNIILGGSSGSE